MSAPIRNFCIIAHIDHGKSTLADRLLEATHTLEAREMREQVLDAMDLERERGITIKAHPIRMAYRAGDGKDYVLNLIDTPGHVDFSYEVSRSLAACEGALLVVDATQGVEAQTISNLYQAVAANLVILPIINKIDLASAEAEKVRHQIVELVGCPEEDILLASAKEGIGIGAVLEQIVRKVPPPKGRSEDPLRALIFDAIFDAYRGAVPYIRVVDGEVRPGMWVSLCSNDNRYEVAEVGTFRLRMEPKDALAAGEVGYVIAGIRELADARTGDTITEADRRCEVPLPGYKKAKPMVFAGLYPTDSGGYELLRDALLKLKLNDASLSYVPETSTALGFGFRCGFLGLLHMDIVKERLEREFGLSLITTVPNVAYRIRETDGTVVLIENPSKLPDPVAIDLIEEPFVTAQILTPAEYIGNLMKLCLDRRGTYKSMEYLDPTRVLLFYELPLAEILFDFYDKLKSVSRGYASLDYELKDYRESDLVKLDILINGDPVDALSAIIHEEKAVVWGRELVTKLRKIIPRQLFEVVIQAAIGSRVIARESVKPLRKNVTAKCYGGDITRKRKLLEKQKEGKRRMKQVGNVEIPQEAFLAVLRAGEG